MNGYLDWLSTPVFGAALTVIMYEQLKLSIPKNKITVLIGKNGYPAPLGFGEN